MYVCSCHGITSHHVAQVVEQGACSSKAVAAACGAGSECGRCRHTVRALITAALTDAACVASA